MFSANNLYNNLLALQSFPKEIAASDDHINKQIFLLCLNLFCFIFSHEFYKK